jgi:20S proteasome alpha/beta subunit
MTQDAQVEPAPELTLDRALSIMKDAFRVAAERDAGTGDRIQIVIMRAGVKPEVVYVQLRED